MLLAEVMDEENIDIPESGSIDNKMEDVLRSLPMDYPMLQLNQEEMKVQVEEDFDEPTGEISTDESYQPSSPQGH